MEQKVITFAIPSDNHAGVEAEINARIKENPCYKVIQVSTCYCPTFEKGQLKYAYILVTLLMEKLPQL